MKSLIINDCIREIQALNPEKKSVEEAEKLLRNWIEAGCPKRYFEQGLYVTLFVDPFTKISVRVILYLYSDFGRLYKVEKYYMPKYIRYL